MVALTSSVIGLEMTRQEALQTIDFINECFDSAERKLNQAREAIWRLKEYNGHKALGYASWRQCAQELLHRSTSEVYRQFNAAVVELAISPIGEMGKIPESVLRPMTKKGFTPATQQMVWEMAREAVGENGKITAGVIEGVIEGIEDILRSGTIQSADGEQTPLGQLMSADIIARVRQVKIAHKEHITHMDKKRNYLCGGVQVDKITRGQLGQGKIAVLLSLGDPIQKEKIIEALRLNKPIYCSLWTEE